METDLVTLRHDEDQEAVAALFARYDFLAAPVVDDQFGLLGIVTHDDVLDVVREEATEDLQRQGRGRADHRRLPGGELRERLVQPDAVAGGAVSPADVHHQRDGVVRVGAEAGGVPGGVRPAVPVGRRERRVAGATLVIRALALEQIRTRDWLLVFRRELLMAAALAVSLAGCRSLRTYFLTPDSILGGRPEGSSGA
jgi:magnesium transporter